MRTKVKNRAISRKVRRKPMIPGRTGACALMGAKEDFELLPALAGLELKRRKLTQELGEVLIEYQQLEFEIDRRSILIPWLIPCRR